MASLHAALKYLCPTNWSDVPAASKDLDPYLGDLFSHAQLIVESIPVQDADVPQTRPRSQTTNSSSSRHSSEQSLSSSVLSLPPHPDHASLRSEWGKPIKLTQKENPLGVSVYKTSGKDSKGAWFARRSVHEDMGFAKFKMALQKEFPHSMEIRGGPGEGNVRGIGAEDRLEKIEAQHGRVEVFRLSAQFPGPTTPRDFVTMLVTSSDALTPHPESEIPGRGPRHYMIISKPCNHPKTQPTSGFVRGQYESVEFIRELPRKLKASQSTTDLTRMDDPSRSSLEKDVLVRNAAQQAEPGSPRGRKNVSFLDIDHPERDHTPTGRKRSATTASPAPHHNPDNYESEDNPIEWIMVTRSDPGGSVPRFMVERGTPASIVADIQKLLTWANKQNFSELDKIKSRDHRNSEQVNGQDLERHDESHEVLQTQASASSPQPPIKETVLQQAEAPSVPQPATPEAPAQGGLMASITGAVEAYTPQAVLDRIPGATSITSPPPTTPPPMHTTNEAQRDASGGATTVDASIPHQSQVDHDTKSISSVSFTSAESHMDTDADTPSRSSQSQSLSNEQAKVYSSQQEKELARFTDKRTDLDAKLAAHRQKVVKDTAEQTEKEKAALRKAEEKHQKELKKHEERYQKEVRKIEERKKKEIQKAEEKRRKELEKDDKVRLTREKEELRGRADSLKKENDVLRGQVGDLQKTNTELVIRLGKYEAGPAEARAKILDGVKDSGKDASRSRSSTLATP